jgi:hypothetical protein
MTDLNSTMDALNGKVAFQHATDAFRSQPTIVQCECDDDAHTLRMEIAGVPAAGELSVPQMPAAEFLCPIVVFHRNALREGVVFTIESEDE